MPRENDYFVCSHCGADVPVGKKFCRECGASDGFGWDDDGDWDAEADGGYSGDNDSDYDEFIEREFGNTSRDRKAHVGRAFFVVVILLLCLSFVLMSLIGL